MKKKEKARVHIDCRCHIGTFIACIPAFEAIIDKYKARSVAFTVRRPCEELLSLTPFSRSITAIGTERGAGRRFGRSFFFRCAHSQAEPLGGDVPIDTTRIRPHARSFHSALRAELAVLRGNKPLRQPRLTRPPIGPRLRRVLIHPGSRNVYKRWPVPYYLKLADMLRGELGLSVHFVTGPDEHDLHSALRRHSDELITVSQEDSLRTVAEQICSSLFCVGNDSGFAHLSSALGVPVVTVFGPSSPFYASSRYAKYFVRPPVRPSSRCSTCSPESAPSCVDHSCMTATAPNEVLKKILLLISDKLYRAADSFTYPVGDVKDVFLQSGQSILVNTTFFSPLVLNGDGRIVRSLVDRLRDLTPAALRTSCTQEDKALLRALMCHKIVVPFFGEQVTE